MKATMFDRYGGFGFMHRVVLSFYDKMLDSDIVAPYFDDVDMPSLVDHQTKFISHALGGPAHYTGRTLEVGHKHLKITHDHFDEVAEILQDTLEDAGMSSEDVDTVMGIVGSTRSAIVHED